MYAPPTSSALYVYAPPIKAPPIGVSHIIVDEIHERGMNEDFLLIILRELLPRRPDLRLVLMSATLNADLFGQYFDGAPRCHIAGFTFPVKDRYLEDFVEATSYLIQPPQEGGKGSGRKGGRDGPSSHRASQGASSDLSSPVMAISPTDGLEGYSEATRRSLANFTGEKVDLDLVQKMLEWICTREPEGAVLVFLTGWDEISKLHETLQAHRMLGDASRVKLLPLHGSMPTVNQRDIFLRPPAGVRKVVLATNIAETSITIDDVVFVLDCGKAKEKTYDPVNKLACLLPNWVSRAAVHQRRGRAGRVQPGVCYHLFTKAQHDAMNEHQLPELLRTPLEELCLQIKSMQLGLIAPFLGKALEPPDPLTVANAIERLQLIGALTENETLTPLGHHLAALPVDPGVGKMILMAAIFGCLSPVLTIAAGLAYRDPFVLPIDKKQQADEVKRRLAGAHCSDHVALLQAYDGWRDAMQRGSSFENPCSPHRITPISTRVWLDTMHLHGLDDRKMHGLDDRKMHGLDDRKMHGLD
ncbi:hypothetical protein CYMTET_50333 [Cymbomonas tetramitiformis]|uniref:RNA helicase n=1 Tax=Cymbomonas tetramitiformis TaxID=36881 RepID=A0AAE0BQ06_9CHLO|nr:hypothetical protein CYMTET_50333 [Cymbomonas tetramitiformis]